MGAQGAQNCLTRRRGFWTAVTISSLCSVCMRGPGSASIHMVGFHDYDCGCLYKCRRARRATDDDTRDTRYVDVVICAMPMPWPMHVCAPTSPRRWAARTAPARGGMEPTLLVSLSCPQASEWPSALLLICGLCCHLLPQALLKTGRRNLWRWLLLLHLRWCHDARE